MGTHGYSAVPLGYWVARPRAACAVLSCAGAYVSGGNGSNACPAGSVRIETEPACRTAIAAAGMNPGNFFDETTPNYPRGCYYQPAINHAWFNSHAVGAGHWASKLLCATGAPTA